MVLINIVNNKKYTNNYYSIFQKKTRLVYLVLYNLFYEYVNVIFVFLFCNFSKKNLVYSPMMF